MKVSYFVIFFLNFFIYSNELRPVKAEIRLNGGRLKGSLLYFTDKISLVFLFFIPDSTLIIFLFIYYFRISKKSCKVLSQSNEPTSLQNFSSQVLISVDSRITERK